MCKRQTNVLDFDKLNPDTGIFLNPDPDSAIPWIRIQTKFSLTFFQMFTIPHFFKPKTVT
jgi:hypothetical protein